MTAVVTSVTKAGFVDDNSLIQTFQGGTFPGKLVLTASRTSLVSGGGVVFSAYSTTRNGYDAHQVLSTGGTTNIGYYWDFDDPNSGTFNTYNGTSKNISVGGWMAFHVFEIADGSGTVTFDVMCTAKDSAGNEATASITITVEAQDSYYSAANTIAISNTLAATGWDALGNDRNPPSGYIEHSSIGSAFTSLNVDDCTGKRIMLYRGDDFSAEGTLHILTGNNNFHFTWFGDELSGTTVTDTTISFAAPSSANMTAGIGGTISDSNNGLGGLTVGAEITVTGTTNNNYKWIIRSVAAGSVTVRYTGIRMVTEAAGSSFTLTEHNKRPEVVMLQVGVDSSGATNLDVTDAQLATAASTFGNDGWCENVYIEGLRLSEVELGSSYQHVTLHNLDMDHEDTANTYGGDLGKIVFGNGDWSWTNSATLDPNSCPFSKGLYLHDITLIGSTDHITTNNKPSINLQGVDYSFPTWFGMAGVTVRRAYEHNCRIQGYQHLVIHDCDFLGQHDGGAGSKARLTLRDGGANQVGDVTGLNRGDIADDSTDTDLYPFTKWGLVQYVWDSASDTGASIYSGVNSAGSNNPVLHHDDLWLHYTIDVTATKCPSTQIALEGVEWFQMAEFTLKAATTGIENKNDEMTFHDGADNLIINGVKSTVANYLGPVYFDKTTPSTYAPPVPSAPR